MSIRLLVLLSFVISIGAVYAETPERLFYMGQFASVLEMESQIHPQMKVLALANQGRFSDATESLLVAGVDRTHPLNALIMAVSTEQVPLVHSRLSVLPEKLRDNYTRLILSSWLSTGKGVLADRLLALVDPEKNSFFSLRFQIREQQQDVPGQLVTLREWAARFPGDGELRTAYARYALSSDKKRPMWDVLFPQEKARRQVAKRAFDTQRYEEGLTLLSGLTQPLSAEMQLAKGLALYHTRKREAALAVFQNIAPASLPKAKAQLLQYQTAKTLQILKRYEEASAAYKAIVESNSTYQAQAYYDLYWIYTASEDSAKFAPFEAGFLAASGKSSYYEKWKWDSAWMSYLNGAVDEAYEKVKNYPWTLQDEFKAKALFWTAEMAEKVDHQMAQTYREKCVTLYPFTYYGARLIVKYFPSEMARLSGLFVPTGVLRGELTQEAYRSGLGGYEAAVLESSVSGRSGKFLDQMVLRLARLYEGLFQSNQAITLLGKMGFSVSRGQATLSREMAELMYPRPQWELVQELGATYGLDPYLILALTREESLFNARAVSRSGARGLMQIMPATGQGIAKNLKVPWTGGDMLFDPETNVRFGAFYLNYLKQRFDGNVVYMLSGYNAGPNATHRWVQGESHESLDIFVANIPYAETHHYVTRVLKSYWIYTLLYNPGHVPDIFRKG